MKSNANSQTNPTTMPIELPLDQMTTAEKMAVIESVWDSIVADPDSFESPAWHGELLAERQAAADRGEMKYSDWEDVKRRLDRLGQ